MQPLLAFILVFTGALFAGTLLTYPLYLLAGLFTEPDFADLAITATQLCGLAFCLLYLKYTGPLNLEALGLRPRAPQWPRRLASSFLGGLGMLAVLALGLLALGIYGFHPGREIDAGSITVLIIGSLLTGLAVALFEETVFRGALLQGLARQAGPAAALVTISLIYAAVHFIDYRQPAGDPGWLTAPLQFLPAYSGLFSLDTADAFLCLFTLGLLLGLVRLRTGSLSPCIGLHAGLVAGVKLFRFFLEYRPADPQAWLVGAHDHRLGYLALMWLAAVTAAYAVSTRRRSR